MINDQKVLGLIPARGGSKGIPKKNIRELSGKPLIAYSIDAALRSELVDRVVVTTDSEEIAAIARSWGADVPFLRPAELAQDGSKTIDCVLHARDELASMGDPYDVIVLLQPTSPLRTARNIDDALACFVNHGEKGLASVSEVIDNPVLVRTLGNDGQLFPILDRGSTVRRQDMEVFYRVNGSIYINRADELTSETSLNDNPIGFVVSQSEAPDIDTFEDFFRVAKMMESV